MPLAPDDMSIFEEKKKIICSVFTTTLQTDRGKKFIKDHEQDSNSQLFYSNLDTFTQSPLEI